MKRGKIKTVLFGVFLALILIIILWFFVRLFSHREIDDVSPGIPCEKEYLEKADVLWVVPEYNGSVLSENKTWCGEILALNKTLGLHGVRHQPFNEFLVENRTAKYLQEGIIIFEKCFNQTPTMFKPPQLAISKENIFLIKSSGLERKGYLNQNVHKVYHCNDGDIIKNRWVDIF